jgi:hypothetical protein
MTFLFLVAALGCQSDSTIHHPIEITGYLDPARMELTSRMQVGDDEVTIAVAGRPGATDSVEPLQIRNTRSDDEVEVDPTEDGAFWTSIDALAGDEIEIAQEGAEAVSLTVETFAPLPEREVSVHRSDDLERAVVNVVFLDPGLDEGWIVSVANPLLSLIADLERTSDVAFEGQITAGADTVLELYGRTPEGVSTLSVGVEVPAE